MEVWIEVRIKINVEVECFPTDIDGFLLVFMFVLDVSKTEDNDEKVLVPVLLEIKGLDVCTSCGVTLVADSIVWLTK